MAQKDQEPQEPQNPQTPAGAASAPPNQDLAALDNTAEAERVDMNWLRGRLSSHAAEAVDTLVEVSRSGVKDADRVKAATDILDRVGLSKEQKISVEHRSISPNVLSAAFAGMARMAGMSASAQEFENVSYREVKDDEGEAVEESFAGGAPSKQPSSGLPGDFLSGLAEGENDG